MYRTLETLTEKGLASKLNISGENRALYGRGGPEHRHYLVCLGCKKIRAVGKCPLGDFDKSLEKETNFLIYRHSLDIYGYCPECLKKAGGLKG